MKKLSMIIVFAVGTSSLDVNAHPGADSRGAELLSSQPSTMSEQELQNLVKDLESLGDCLLELEPDQPISQINQRLQQNIRFAFKGLRAGQSLRQAIYLRLNRSAAMGGQKVNPCAELLKPLELPKKRFYEEEIFNSDKRGEMMFTLPPSKRLLSDEEIDKILKELMDHPTKPLNSIRREREQGRN